MQRMTDINLITFVFICCYRYLLKCEPRKNITEEVDD